ncbi:MAG: hypothetical protein QNK04_10700 [Myxococcota bacterium]|nr:hypothetical protein [Myxococcota bacterium]
MNGNGLGTKGRNLNEAFFVRAAEALRVPLCEEEEAVRRDLALASGIDDDEILGRLSGLGIRADTLAALTLVPLVEVAWADGHMDPRERDAILQGAVGIGVAEGSWSYRLLRIWTQDPPAPELFELWEDFMAALVARLTDDERAEFRRKLVGRAREVAEAAAGLLGLGPRVSESEARVLGRLGDAFGPPPAAPEPVSG